MRDSSNSIAHEAGETASLQETAATTIEEFTSTVRLNAEYAQQASMLVARMFAIAHVPDCAISGPARSIRETGSRNGKH
ncbi:hypothetical protein [Burkholderia diffusa]|uniref:hypothetical protein n=1 Tax=Burkholderia diffusa TaxID=488732 RepID=UPI00075ADF7E|nr:hypothetical protein WI71_00870 [Burkholderia diffusa]KVH46231.1 hypothetical protein WJ39_21090 [Burkholderia diffusa]